jgi:hypothetical protein
MDIIKLNFENLTASFDDMQDFLEDLQVAVTKNVTAEESKAVQNLINSIMFTNNKIANRAKEILNTHTNA